MDPPVAPATVPTGPATLPPAPPKAPPAATTAPLASDLAHPEPFDLSSATSRAAAAGPATLPIVLRIPFPAALFNPVGTLGV